MKVLSVVFAALCVVVAVQAGCFKGKGEEKGKKEKGTKEPVTEGTEVKTNKPKEE